MARTNKPQAWKEWHGFAVELKPDTELGLAILVAEYESGAYEPIAVSSTINEAKELAASNAAARTKRGGEAVSYKLWSQGIDGRYLTVPVVIR